MSDNAANLICFLVLAVAFLIGFGTGMNIGDSGRMTALKGEAVTRGYAEWKVDPKTGTTTWQWKESK